MENTEFYNCHYLIVDERGRITDGWSDGPHPERDTDGATLLTDEGGYQFRLRPDWAENPPLTDEYGVPLYCLTDGVPVARSQAEVENDRAENPSPPVTPEEESTVWDELDAAYREGVESV